MIQKEKVGNYNYETHEFQWKITVNPNGLPIENATVTDMLEESFEFGEVTKVEYEDQGGKSDQARAEKLNNTRQDGSDQTVLTLGYIDKPYTIYLTTIATEKWRDDHFLNQLPDTANAAIQPINNKAVLNGTIYDVPIQDASDSDTNVIKKSQIGKTGTYNKEDGTIDWTIDLNKEQYNLQGLHLKEKLDDCKGDNPAKPIHELDPGSIQVYTVTHENGKEELTPVTLTEDMLEAAMQGFTYYFDDEKEDYQTYRFTFTTVLTAYAKGSDAKITNEVWLADDEEKQDNISNSSDGGYHGDFDIKQSASAKKRPRIEIYKVSSNSVNTQTNHLLLNDVEFTLSVHEFDYQKDGTLKILDEKAQYGKKSITEEGEIWFSNIKTTTSSTREGNDLICVLTEKNPKAGYQKPGEKYYIYFQGEKSLITNTPNKIVDADGKELVSGKEIGEYYKVNDLNAFDETERNKVELRLENQPVDSSFTFKKNEIQWSTYQDMPDSGLNALPGKPTTVPVFEVIPQDGLKDHVNTQTVRAESDGSYIIKNLDEGRYKLEEITASPGLKKGHAYFNVTWNGDAYEYTFEDPVNMISNTEGEKVFTDELKKTTVSFLKKVGYQDGSGNQIVKDNEEPLAGVNFQLESTGQITDEQGNLYGVLADKVVKTATSDQNGKVEFEDVPAGTYNIYELKKENSDDSPVGYTPVTENNGKRLVYQLEVTENEDSQTALNVTWTKKVEDTGTKDDTTGDTTEQRKIYNHPIKGSLTFKKTITGLNNVPLSNLASAKFGLFRKIGDVTAAEPLYEKQISIDGNEAKVEFAGVEYGDYVLKEIVTPQGFTTMNPVEIKRTALGAESNADSFTYIHAADLTNQLEFSTTINFVKKGLDGEALPNIEFALYRKGKGEVIDGNGANLIVDAKGDNKYYRYSFRQTLNDHDNISTGDEGKFVLSNLPMGEYLLVEQEGHGLDLQDDRGKKVVYIQVQPQEQEEEENHSGAWNYSITVKEHNHLGLEGNDDNGWTIPANTDWSEPLNASSDGAYDIVNYPKYGFVNLHKIAQEEDSTTHYPASHVTFAIYKKNADGTVDQPYLTIQTNKAGQFEYDAQGAYFDETYKTSKHLYFGEYLLKEVTPPGGCAVSKTAVDGIAFKIGEGKTEDGTEYTGHEGTAWISLDQNGAEKVQYVPKAPSAKEAASTDVFVNQIERGAFSIRKTSSENPNELLSGAVFAVKAGNTVVARLQEKPEEKGIYVLTNEGIGTPEKNANGIPYLYKDEENGFQLLKGSYTIEEMTPPTGYTITKRSIPIDLGTDGLLKVDQQEAADPKQLTITNDPMPIRIVKRDQKNNQVLAGAEFAIEGTFVKAGEPTQTEETTKTVTSTTENGGVQLSGLIAGKTYTLTETKAPTGYFRYTGTVKFTVEADRTLTIKEKTEDQRTTIAWDNDNRTLTISDTPIILQIVKKDAQTEEDGTDIPLKGTVFQLLDTDQKTVLENNLTTDKDGQVSIDYRFATDQTYYLKEAQASTGYVTPDAVTAFTVSDQGVVTLAEDENGLNVQVNLADKSQMIVENTRMLGRVLLKKVGFNQEALNGTEFTLYRTQDGQKKDEAIGTFITGKQYTGIKDQNPNDIEPGSLQISGLAWGSYKLIESSPSAGYQIDQQEYPFTVGSTNVSETIKVNGGNAIQNEQNQLTFAKTDLSGNLLSGAEFTIKNKENSAETYTLTLENGQAVLQGTLASGKTYLLRESKAPNGYSCYQGEVEFTVETDGTMTVAADVDQKAELSEEGKKLTLKNSPIQLKIVKKDQDKVITEGTATFELLDSEKKHIKELSTINGEVTFGSELAVGETYYLKEVKAPEGYETPVGDAALIGFTVNTDGTAQLSQQAASHLNVSVDENGKTLEIQNSKTRVSVLKIDADTQEAVTGGTFGIYHVNDNIAEANPIIQWENTDGMAYELPNGTLAEDQQYKLAELTRPNGYLKAKAVEFTPNELTKVDGSWRVVMEDRKISTTLNLIKTYGDSDERIPGIRFDLLQGEQVIETEETNASGELTFSGADGKGLGEGTYTIRESEDQPNAPDGVYIDHQTTTTVTITAGGDDETETVLNVKYGNGDEVSVLPDQTPITITNAKFTAGIELKKVDQADTTHTLAGVQFTLEKQDQNGTWSSYTTSDGVTDQDGVLRMQGLTKGRYRLTESQTVTGYTVGTKPFTVEFTVSNEAQGKTLAITAGNVESEAWDLKVTQGSELLEGNVLTNERLTGSVSLQKTDQSETPKGLVGAKFTLYRWEGEKPELSEEHKVGEYTTGENGMLEITGLEWGTYKLIETVPPEGYKLNSGAAHEFTIQADHLEEKWGTVANAVNHFVLEKTDLSGKQLAGAVFRLVDRSPEHDGEIVFAELRIGEDGTAEMSGTGLVHGRKYELQELQAPEGYVRRTEPLSFYVNEDGSGTLVLDEESEKAAELSEDMQTIRVKNEHIALHFAKKCGEKAVPGTTTFELYEEGQEGAVGRYQTDEKTGTLVIDDYDFQTDHMLTEDVEGKIYTLKEVQAADTFVTPQGEAAETKFRVTDDGAMHLIGTNETTAMDHSLVIQNTETELPVLKTDEDGTPLIGAELAIYPVGEDGEVKEKAVDSWTSGGKPHRVKGKLLENGTYILKETKRPHGYRKADDVSFTLQNGIPVMPNEHVEEKNGVWTVVMKDPKVFANLSLEKSYADDQNPIEGVAFDLTGTAKDSVDSAELVKMTARTAADGTLTFANVPEGRYQIRENLKESTADSAYIDESKVIDVEVTVDPSGEKVILKYAGDKGSEITAPIPVENERFRAAVTLQKTDEQDADEKLAGVTFLLEKKNGATFAAYPQEGNQDGTYQTDENGVLTIQNLEKGVYRLTETASVHGYQPLTSELFRPFSAEFEVANENYKGTLAITKENADKAEWNLRVTEGEDLLKKEVLTNTRVLGSVTLQKTDGESNGLNGTVFRLYRKTDGNWLENAWNFVTGNRYEIIGNLEGSKLEEEGRLTIGGLEWGEYKLVEIIPTDGYQIDRDNCEFAFTIGRTEQDITLAFDHGEIVNLPNEFTIQKVNAKKRQEVLAGAEFEIRDKESGAVVAERITSGEDGTVRLTKTLVGGKTYILRETKAPDGYLRYPGEVEFSMTTDGKVVLEETTDARVAELENNTIVFKDEPIVLNVFKKSGTKAVNGVTTFALLDAAKNPIGSPLKTNAKGELKFTHLFQTDGTLTEETEGSVYYLKELRAADGYVTPQEEAAELAFTVADDGTIHLLEKEEGLHAKLTSDGTAMEIQNTKTELQILKTDGENPIAGGTFAVYPKDSAEEVDRWENDGTPHVLKGKLLEDGTYVLKELQRPQGYLLRTETLEFTLENGVLKDSAHVVKEDGTQTVVMTDEEVLQNVSLVKTLKGTDKPLAGVAFDLLENDRVLATAVTGDRGMLTFEHVPEGKYQLRENLKESTADSVYIDESKVIDIEVTVTEDGTKPALKQGKEVKEILSVENVPFAAALTLRKEDPEDGTPLAGVTFLLERKRGGAYEAYDPQGRGHGAYRTDENGILEISGLEKGAYRLTETASVYGYQPLTKEVFRPFGAEFEVTNENYGQTLAITEAHAEKAEWKLHVTEGEELLRGDVLVNERIKGSVTLQKTDGEANGLNGTVFGLYKKKDGNWLERAYCFVTGKQYENVEDITGKDVSEKGRLTIRGLDWGEYKLVEETPTAGYQTDGVEYTFQIGRLNADIRLAVDQGTIVNLPNEMTILKTNAEGSKTLAGAEFSVTNQKNSEERYTVVTGEDGKAVLTQKLTGGETYVVHETKAPEGYQLSLNDIVFTIGKDGQAVVDNRELAGNRITVADSLTRLSFQKTAKFNESCSAKADETKPLGGAEFTIYSEEAPQQEIAKAVSGEDGTVVFEGLKTGTYLVKETNTLPGYRPNTEVYKAVITDEPEKEHVLCDAEGTPLQDNTVVNDVYRADIRFVKVNEQNPDEVLPDSEYGLFKKKQAAKANMRRMRSAEEDELELIATAVTDADGVLKFTGVLMNTEYIVKELRAPNGSYVSEKPMKITFKVDEKQNVVISDFESGEGTAERDEITGEIVWLEPSVEVEFYKQDSEGNMLQGAHLQIQDQDGNVVESWISEETPYLSHRMLTIGETYRLVETEAPTGYLIADPVEFTVPDEEVGPGENKRFAVTMVDEKKPEDQPTTPPEDKPTTPPEDKPTTPPEDKPTTPPEDQPTTPPEDKPTTPPEDNKPMLPPEALKPDAVLPKEPDQTVQKVENASQENTGAAKTGDVSLPFFYGILAALSAGIAGITASRRKKRR